MQIKKDEMEKRLLLAAREEFLEKRNNFVQHTLYEVIRALASPDKQASKALVEEYLEQTNKYYGIHISALDSVSLLDTTSDENADKFIEVFDSYSASYNFV